MGRAIQMRSMPSMPHCLPLFSSLIYIVSGEMSIHQQHHFLKGIRFSFQVGDCNGQWACRENSKRDDSHLLSTGIKPLSLNRLGYLYKLPPCMFAPLSPLLLGPLNGRKFGSSCIIELLAIWRAWKLLNSPHCTINYMLVTS